MNHNVWVGVIGKHGLGNANGNGIQLLNLCSEFGLVTTNIRFNNVTRGRRPTRVNILGRSLDNQVLMQSLQHKQDLL